jgi:hypothetical protein
MSYQLYRNRLVYAAVAALALAVSFAVEFGQLIQTPCALMRITPASLATSAAASSGRAVERWVVRRSGVCFFRIAGEDASVNDMSPINRELAAGERLLWSGQPRQGVTLRGSDALMIPFSLLWGGLAFFWEWSVINSNAPAFFMLWGIPFVAVGLYLILGRFFVEAWQRSRTHYAVTSERVLIVEGLFKNTVRSVSLRTLSEMSLSESSSGEGTIHFGPSSLPSFFRGFSGWPGMKERMGPMFDRIADARIVRDLVNGAQKALSG